MRYLFMVEMPTRVLSDKRLVIKRELKAIAKEIPKRNVFLLEVESSKEVEKIKSWILDFADPESKVNYYRLFESPINQSSQLVV